MLTHKDHFHGSDLEKIEKVYGIKKEELVSYSANVNPLGLSDNLKEHLARHLDVITGYPDREYTQLRREIAAYTGAQPEYVLVGNGSTELISHFIQTLHPQKALILGPTYSEYERDISLGGGISLYYPLKEEQNFILDVEGLCAQLHEGLDLLVLCNPNNPTSTAVTNKNMRRILDVCLQYGIFVMVDETYVEFAPEPRDISSVSLTNYYTNLIILRGTSKFFACPGLRLGYAITGNLDLLQEINQKKDPWSVNSLAELAGQFMFRDESYIQKTKELIHSERERIYQELSSWNSVKVYPGCANFLLVRILKKGIDAQQLFDHCIRQKMMIRNCSTFPFLDETYFRFCLMLPGQNDHLTEAFLQLLK